MDNAISTQVCIAGGGPAGMMLGLILARAGIDVVVLEKHTDFLRDFRGDTVHPSTLDLIDQLGLRGKFDAIAHADLTTLDLVLDGIRLHAVDFGSLKGVNRAVTLMPQWDLLDLLASEAKRHPSFQLMMGVEAVDVLGRDGRIVGVMGRSDKQEIRVAASVTIAADGRSSAVRRALGLRTRAFGVPIDVAWFRLDRPARAMPDTLGHVHDGQALVTIPRPAYLQCGMLIAKGSFEHIRGLGLPAFQSRIVRAAPRLASVATGLRDWSDVRLLSVQLDRLDDWWRPGALCIGDAAHAMSPVFGVGINFAIQDAVATANRLVPVLRAGVANRDDIDRALRAIQRRRLLPTRLMQRIQRGAHAVIDSATSAPVLHNPPTLIERTVLRLALPIVRRLLARLVGRGFRPERIDAGILG